MYRYHVYKNEDSGVWDIRITEDGYIFSRSYGDTWDEAMSKVFDRIATEREVS